MLEQFKSVIPFKGIYIATIVVFLSTDTRFAVPYATTLRWVLPAVLLVLAGLKSPAGLRFAPNGTYALMIAYFAFTIFNSSTPRYSIERLISLALIVGMCCTYYKLLGGIGKLDAVVIALGMVYVVYGLINILNIGRYDGSRLIGIAGNVNSLGLECNLALVFATFFYEKAEKRYKKYWLVIMCLVAAEAVLSGSRTAFALLVLWSLYFAVFVMQSKWMIFIPCILVIVLLLPKDLLTSIPGLDRLLTAGATRDEIWDYGLKVYRQRPWMGWGYATANTKTSMAVAEGLGFHSSYITILIETGRIGLVLVAALCLSTLINAHKCWQQNRSLELRTMMLGFVEMLAAFYGESSMTSAGSVEGFIFWSLLVWIAMKCGLKEE